jgi:hypothetical protein
LAKHFVWQKLSKKVQFLQPNNDDMIKKVYTMAWKYMKYDADDFSSVWAKVVLPTIKSEMNLLRSGYVAAIKKSSHSWLRYTYCWMCICLQLINKPIACLPQSICIVLVTNSTEFVIHNGTVVFSLDNWWMATMIAEKHKGDFDTYFFVIDNFI